MKTKLQRVIQSCTTLSQVNSAANYLYLYGIKNGINAEYLNACMDIEQRIEDISGASIRDAIDYKAYAEHLIHCGKLDLANDFIEYAEKSINRIRIFA